MARYVTRRPAFASSPRCGEPDGENYVPRQISESEPVNTGILNAEGKPIYRVPDPIGFVRPKE